MTCVVKEFYDGSLGDESKIKFSFDVINILVSYLAKSYKIISYLKRISIEFKFFSSMNIILSQRSLILVYLFKTQGN